MSRMLSSHVTSDRITPTEHLRLNFHLRACTAKMTKEWAKRRIRCITATTSTSANATSMTDRST
jgi:hypothetical protein